MRIVNKGSEWEATRLRPSEQLRPTDLHRSVRATIIMDGDWLVERLARFKSQDPKRRIWKRLRSALAIFFAVIGVAATILNQSPFPLLVLGGLTLLFYIIHKLDIYLIKARLRSSPHWNDRIEVSLSKDGYGTVSPHHESKLAWKVFAESVAFPTGCWFSREKILQLASVSLSGKSSGCRIALHLCDRPNSGQQTVGPGGR